MVYSVTIPTQVGIQNSEVGPSCVFTRSCPPIDLDSRTFGGNGVSADGQQLTAVSDPDNPRWHTV
jgi:hypothetical protein